MNLYYPAKKAVLAAILTTLISLSIFSATIFILVNNLIRINKEVLTVRGITGGVEQAFAIKGELNDLEGDLEVLDSFFVKQDGEVSFIESIESLAQSHGLKISINSINIDPKTASGLKEDLHINLDAEGGRQGVLAFMKSLESMPQVVLVENAQLSFAEGDSVWRLKASFSAFKLK